MLNYDNLRLTLLASLLVFPALAQEASDSVAPEISTPPAVPDESAQRPVVAKKYMVAAANPLAAEAGEKVLAAGGNAVDAMVAVQTVLGLVEPQSSGLGGGAFAVYWSAAENKLYTFDGRETAPAAATPLLFQDENGEPLEFFDAVIGGRSVGVPGTPRLLETMHEKFGSAEWADLLAPAMKLAEEGFEVSPRLAGLLAEEADRLTSDGTASAYFLPEGKPLEEGTLLKNADYAATLKILAEDGADGFYKGQIARDIVRAVRGATGNPGVMVESDLANYQVKSRDPVCMIYREREVCGMGPPSSGALTVGQILGISSHFDLPSLGPDDPESWRIIGDASRLAFADRGRYMADSDFVPVPVEGLLDPDYLGRRADLMKGDKALADDEVEAGSPEWDHAFLLADDQALELPSTSHFSIVDEAGNALSVTTTIENGFGSRVMVRGFLLNNELTDFSFASHEDGIPVANRVEPGKRPRSSMAPTIVLEDDKPVLLIGSPGGSRIIGYVAKTIIAHFDWDMNIRQAIELPHRVNRFGTYDIEEGPGAEAAATQLEALGFETNIRDLNSGLHGIVIAEDGLRGAADPRREGVALGE